MEHALPIHNTDPLGNLAHPSPTFSGACWDQFSFRGIYHFLRIHKYRQSLPPLRCHVLWAISWMCLNWYHLRAIFAAYALCLRSCNLQIDSFFIICLWHVTPLVCQQCEAREHVYFAQQFILWSEHRDCGWQALNEVLQALMEWMQVVAWPAREPRGWFIGGFPWEFMLRTLPFYPVVTRPSRIVF